MSLSKYRAFIRVADVQSFTEAASKLCCSQSAVSKMIADLEEQWGFKLFDRKQKRVQLTKDGEDLYPFISAVVNADNNLLSVLTDRGELVAGHLKIAAFSSIASLWLPEVIEKFQCRFPGIRYEITITDYPRIEAEVLSGKADLGFTCLRPISDLDSFLLGHDALLAVFHQNNPLKNKRVLNPQDFESFPFFCLEGQRKGPITGYFNVNKVSPKIELKTLEDIVIINMIRRNLGIGILPSMIIENLGADLEVRPLSPPLKKELLLLVPKRNQLTLVAKKFLSVFSEVLGSKLDKEFRDKFAPRSEKIFNWALNQGNCKAE